MLSRLLYCKDKKGLHYTAAKVRSNASSEINGEEEPRAHPRLRVSSAQAAASQAFTKPALLLPHYVLKGHQGL